MSSKAKNKEKRKKDGEKEDGIRRTEDGGKEKRTQIPKW
jgi:hypothetical protein